MSLQIVLQWLIFIAIMLLHLSLAPYTKVEESFNMQATHDILTYGIPTKNVLTSFRALYDHFSFPGSVPRTFVGALVLAGTSRPFIWLNDGVDRQYLVRAILGLFNASALAAYAMGVYRAFGRTTSAWYTLFQASQFHVMYYGSRTLPNMFAFGLCTLALRFLLPSPSKSTNPNLQSKHHALSLYLLTLTGIIFRSELAVLLFTTTSYLYLTGRITFRHEILPAAISASLIGLSLTVAIDTFFWQSWPYPLWPELTSLFYNVLSGHSSNWGTSPLYYYFYSSLPKLLLNPLSYALCIPLSLYHPSTRSHATSLLIPSLNFLVLYSLLPHKEWRFIIYVVPPITASASLGAAHIWLRRSKTLLYRLLSVLLVTSVFLSFLISTCILLPISSMNYPGGAALDTLHSFVESRNVSTAADHDPVIIKVHVGNLACQTGVTRFLQKKPALGPDPDPDPDPYDAAPQTRRWIYDKTENEHLLSSPEFWERFDFVIVEDPKKVVDVGGGGGGGHEDEWEAIGSVSGFTGVRVLGPGGMGWLEEIRGRQDRDWKWERGRQALAAYLWGEEMMRKYVTRGWWVGVLVEERIWILKRVFSPWQS